LEQYSTHSGRLSHPVLIVVRGRLILAHMISGALSGTSQESIR
jgi:hypothetical protein